MGEVFFLSDYRPQGSVPPAMWKRIKPGHWQLTDGTRCWATITPYNSGVPKGRGGRGIWTPARYLVDFHAPDKRAWVLASTVKTAKNRAANWLHRKTWDAPRILNQNAG